MGRSHGWFWFMTIKILIVVLGLYGIYKALTFQGTLNLAVLVYYTVLSNLVCVLYFGASLAVNIGRALRREFISAINPRLEAGVVFCILIAFLIYNFLILPSPFGYHAVGAGLASMCLHLFVPLLALIDWLAFAPKGRLKTSDPILWLFIQMVYCAFILIRGHFYGGIGSHPRYLYPFMDLDTLSVGRVVVNIAFVALGMGLLGFIILVCDRALINIKAMRVQ